MEMERLRIYLQGIREIKWKALRDYLSGEYRIKFNSDESQISIRGLIVNKNIGHKIKYTLTKE